MAIGFSERGLMTFDLSLRLVEMDEVSGVMLKRSMGRGSLATVPDLRVSLGDSERIRLRGVFGLLGEFALLLFETFCSFHKERGSASMGTDTGRRTFGFDQSRMGLRNPWGTTEGAAGAAGGVINSSVSISWLLTAVIGCLLIAVGGVLPALWGGGEKVSGVTAGRFFFLVKTDIAPPKCGGSTRGHVPPGSPLMLFDFFPLLTLGQNRDEAPFNFFFSCFADEVRLQLTLESLDFCDNCRGRAEPFTDC